jgi:hypothetical protein
MTAAVIELDRLIKRCGDVRGIEGVCLRVEAAEAFGFLAPNAPASQARRQNPARGVRESRTCGPVLSPDGGGARSRSNARHALRPP